MSRESIKRKIAALRAKTTSSGCTEAEAVAAAALAAKLMREHGVNAAEIEFVTARARAPLSMPRWHGWLADAICKATNTYVIFCLGDIREIEVAGKEHAVEIALYLRDVLARAVNAEIRTLRETTPYRRLRKTSSKSAMVNSFAAGMMLRLSAKLHELFSDTINAEERAVATQVLTEKYQDARKMPVRKFTVTHRSAYVAGHMAGEAVQLSHGVAGKAAAPRMLEVDK